MATMRLSNSQQKHRYSNTTIYYIGMIQRQAVELLTKTRDPYLRAELCLQYSMECRIFHSDDFKYGVSKRYFQQLQKIAHAPFLEQKDNEKVISARPNIK